VLDEHLGRSRHDVERVTGALGDVEQAMMAVGEVQDQTQSMAILLKPVTAHRAMESTLATVWLAFQIQIGPVGLKDVAARGRFGRPITNLMRLATGGFGSGMVRAATVDVYTLTPAANLGQRLP
jgi:hypothetical protein